MTVVNKQIKRGGKTRADIDKFIAGISKNYVLKPVIAQFERYFYSLFDSCFSRNRGAISFMYNNVHFMARFAMSSG